MATIIHSNLISTLRKCFLSCPACLSIFAPLLIHCQKANGQADQTSRSRNQPVKPSRVVGNIYYVGAPDVTSFLITTAEGHILLDGGFAETVPQIEQSLAALGFRLQDVKILINSHAHYDHAGGLAGLKKPAGAIAYLAGVRERGEVVDDTWAMTQCASGCR